MTIDDIPLGIHDLNLEFSSLMTYFDGSLHFEFLLCLWFELIARVFTIFVIKTCRLSFYHVHDLNSSFEFLPCL